MRAGRYPIRATVIEIPLTRGAAGGLVAGTAMSIAERWLRIDSVTGSERFSFAQMNSTVTHRIEFRQYTTGIAANMKLLFGARVFEVIAVLHDEVKQRWTRLICNELADIPASIGEILQHTGLADLRAGLFSERPGTADEGDLYAAIDTDTMYIWFDPTQP